MARREECPVVRTKETERSGDKFVLVIQIDIAMRCQLYKRMVASRGSDPRTCEHVSSVRNAPWWVGSVLVTASAPTLLNCYNGAACRSLSMQMTGAWSRINHAKYSLLCV